MSSDDLALLERQFGSARAFVEQYERAAGPARTLEGTFQLGDWLDPSAPPENPFEALTSPVLVADAYFAHSAARLAHIAGLLGRTDDVQRFETLTDAVRRAFAARYIDAAGRLRDDTQTAYSLAIAFGLFPDAETAERGGERLAELVRSAGGRIATGFAGTNLVSDALTESGHLDEAYLLLSTDENPSWLYPVSMGATTIWERWDSMLPDGTVNPGDMTSFNHYALGAVASWLHRVAAGIEATSPGFRTIRFAPRPGGGLTSAGASHITPYGLAEIDWELDADGGMQVRAVVPAGTSAVLEIAGHEAVALEVGEQTLRFPAA